MLKFCIIIIGLLLSSQLYSAESVIFYRISVNEPWEKSFSYKYFGSIDLKFDEINKIIVSGGLIPVKNLRAWNGVSWTTWKAYDKTATDEIYINAKAISSIMPMSGDPLITKDANDGLPQKF